MNDASFNESFEQFAEILFADLHAKQPMNITNAYVKQYYGSKYLYIHLIFETGLGARDSENKEQTIEMVISYDRFYQVPVLHFRVDDKVDYASQYTAIDIHPILQAPYVVVHACETENMMSPTNLHGVEYLKLWFALQMTMVFPQIELRGRQSAETISGRSN
ncbi:Autophagocytosis associated protein, active-site domain [Metschnikowia aff. pulcherrima]|uniref:Autophagocytosis associated protein, active-site domain n=1 Tax=Metschnikowia aff. pulcherrima TaxID=2163413 RepID=A0A4P6XQL2_9ASCO|nr:Autophagocytosis associated protein, active-site domain [Metschnikowia aff. pulcherrima]